MQYQKFRHKHDNAIQSLTSLSEISVVSRTAATEIGRRSRAAGPDALIVSIAPSSSASSKLPNFASGAASSDEIPQPSCRWASRPSLLFRGGTSGSGGGHLSGLSSPLTRPLRPSVRLLDRPGSLSCLSPLFLPDLSSGDPERRSLFPGLFSMDPARSR